MPVKRSKVVLDTNVVVSAAISSDGNPATIFEMLIQEKIENFTTPSIIDEIEDVLGRPRIMKRLSLEEKQFILDTFIRFSTQVKPTIKIKEVKDDPDDDKFLECAVTADAKYIISGDPHLLNIKNFRNIKIVSPAQFLKIFRK